MWFFQLWLLSYCVVHAMLRSKPLQDSFAKYIQVSKYAPSHSSSGSPPPSALAQAGGVYRAKSGFVLLLLVLQYFFRMKFHSAAVFSFTYFAVEMMLRFPTSTASRIYAASACGLLLELFALNNHYYWGVFT